MEYESGRSESECDKIKKNYNNISLYSNEINNCNDTIGLFQSKETKKKKNLEKTNGWKQTKVLCTVHC